MKFQNLVKYKCLEEKSLSQPLKHLQCNHEGHRQDKLLTQFISTLSSLYPLAKNSTQRKKIKHMKTRLANEGLNQTNRLDAIQIIKEHYAR